MRTATGLQRAARGPELITAFPPAVYTGAAWKNSPPPRSRSTLTADNRSQGLGAVMRDDTPPPQPGDVFALREDDYKYGKGPLVAHVTEVVEQVEDNGEPWWNIVAEVATGTLISNTGMWNERPLYIREKTFPRTRRESGT